MDAVLIHAWEEITRRSVGHGATDPEMRQDSKRMNTDPYPAGRWTQRNGSSKSCAARIRSESVASLRRAPLRELFWAAAESGMVEDARLRIEMALSNALANAPLAVIGEETSGETIHTAHTAQTAQTAHTSQAAELQAA